MITVVIPTYNQINYTNELFESINKNIIKPKRIILIDDCGTDKVYKIVKKYKNLNITFIRHETNKGLNYSWNEGINLSTTPITSILNNDIVLNKYFFKKIIDSYYIKDWTLICPFTVKTKKEIELSKDEILIFKEIGKREGWCWTGKTSYLNKILPIPSNLKMYFGDDYIFFRIKNDKLPALKIMNNFVYHYGGATVGITQSCSGLREKERYQWNKYKENFLK
jgi:glycosyltransferase involved in cell wall biosynthesis